MLYSISYDLSADNSVRTALENEINAMGRAIRCLASTWLLISENSASDIRLRLETVAQGELYCIITEIVGKNNAWKLDINRGVRDWRTENHIEMS